MDMEAANRYIKEIYLPAYNAEFMSLPQEEGSAFVPRLGQDLTDILCEQFERVVAKDNCVQFETLKLQIPADHQRMHYVKVRVKVNRYPNGSLAIFHGPRCLARYTAQGSLINQNKKVAA
jgi:hypothetical protein